MNLRMWTQANQIALENLEIHLQHWQQFLEVHERLLDYPSNLQPLQASLRRHFALSLRTKALLDQQRLLLLQLQISKEHPFTPTEGC